MRLVGTKARWRDTSASALTAFLDAIRKGVQAVASYNSSRATFGRPAVQLQKACDFRIMAFLPGSLQMGMGLPEPSQTELFAQHASEELRWFREAQAALGEYLAVARWAAENLPAEELERIVPEFQKRRILLRAVKPLVPRARGGIEYVELSGAAVPGRTPIYLSAAASVRLSSALEAAVSETEERYTGDIREMDLDRRTFRLRNIKDKPGEVACYLPEDLGPITATFLGKRARVIGTRTAPNQPLQVSDIEQIEPEPVGE